jgi:hypothetical protein
VNREEWETAASICLFVSTPVDQDAVWGQIFLYFCKIQCEHEIISTIQYA